MISMLKAKIDGSLLAKYFRDSKTQDGKFQTVRCFDLYVGRDLVRVSKIPEKYYDAVCVGEGLCDFPVRVYNGQYGLSCVYDDESEGGAT